jgi:hypothetical protein
MSSQYQVAARGGIHQQLRYTFSNEGLSDDAFIQTVTVLREMAEKYKDDPEVIRFARRLYTGNIDGNHIRNFDELGEIASVTKYFQGTYTSTTTSGDLGRPLLPGDKGSYRYLADPYDTEYFQSPAKVLRDIQAGESGADCDDIAMTAACVMAASGRPVMLMVVDADEGSPGNYNHVLLATRTIQPNNQYGSDFFPIELIHPFAPGESVRITSYIPLLVRDYDLTPKENRLIPSHFR